MQPLIVSGTLDSLEKIRKYTLLAAKNAGLEKARAYKLGLAVDEIATNIINYGYQKAGLEGSIIIDSDLDEHALTITLDDTAGYFDPTLKPPPPPEYFSQQLEERAIGGWGVYLALQSVDQFQYRRFQDHNQNIFIMYRATHGEMIIIESKKDSCVPVSEHLASIGYTVTIAENGKKALDLMQEKKYEMLMFDLPMNDHSAEEFIKGMKADNAIRGIPVIILANPIQLEAAENCIKSGAEDYIVLPFSPVVLDARVSVILERQRVRNAEQTLRDSVRDKRDNQIGRQIQIGFLPESLPQLPGWDIAARFEPGHEVGGDFYDSFSISNNRISLIMGDIRYSGINAAVFTALYRSLLRVFTLREYQDRPSNLTNENNQDKSEQAGEEFSSEDSITLKNAIELANNYSLDHHNSKKVSATIFFGILDVVSGKLIYINAGFEPPLIINQRKVKSRLKQTASAVGLHPDFDYKIRHAQLEPGDTLLIISDSVIKAKNPPGQSFGWNGLVELVEKEELSATALLDKIEKNIHEHISDSAQDDDITMLAVTRPV